MFDRGLRRSEVAGLDIAHLDVGGSRVEVLGKGKRERTPLTIAPETLEAIQSWVEVRGDHPGPLFQSLDNRTRGHRLTGTSLARIVGGHRQEGRPRPGALPRPTAQRLHRVAQHGPGRVQRWGRWATLAIVSRYDDSRKDPGGKASAALAAAV